MPGSNTKAAIGGGDRAGEEPFFPLLDIAIGIVEPDILYCTSHHDVANLAAEAKKQAK